MKSFGIKFIEDNIVELYVNDGESWYFKARYDHLWLADLKRVIVRADEENPFKGNLS